MSSSEKSVDLLHPEEKIKAGPGVAKVKTFGYGAGLVMLIAGIAWGAALGDGMQRFLHSYLLAFVYLTSMAVGALFFVVIMYLMGAKWSIVYRRTAECITMAFPLLFLMSVGIWLPLLLGNDSLFVWSNHDYLHGNPNIPFFGEGSHLVASKTGYLNPVFFTLRICLYFIVWIAVSRFFHKTSLRQDENGDDEGLNQKMIKYSAPAMFAFAFSTAFFGFDMIMSLDPAWFSTMFGVIFFAGACISIFALLVLIPMALQRSGRLTHSITTEHYHEIGKFLFAFIFFWAYVAFSQFMLIWGANIPEETGYFLKRWFEFVPAGGNNGVMGPWAYVALALLAFHFAIPFILMMTRHSKRRLTILASFSVWMLVWHYIDLYWQVMPSLSNHAEKYRDAGNIFKMIPLDILVVAGMGLLFMGAVAGAMSKVNLIAIKDPGLKESLRFENQ